MELLLLTLSTIVFFFFLLHGLGLYRKRRMPPGPTGLPIIGSLLDIGPKPHESLAKLSQKHGPLMTIRLGNVTSVVASTADAAREILQRQDEACSGRMIPDAVNALDNRDKTVLWISSSNESWRTIRKALNTYLTNQHKLDSLRGLRQNVVDEMLEFLNQSAQQNKLVNIGYLAFAVAVNQISNTCFSRNLTNYESGDVGGFKTAVKTLMEIGGKFNIADVFPILRPLDPQNIRRQIGPAYAWLENVMQGFIDERLKHRELKLPRFGDMLDSLLDYSEDHAQAFNHLHIRTLFVDLFIAGTETNSNTIEWAISELLLNPDMFARVRKEVSTIVGEDGKIQEEKLLNLPYLHAVIKETLRLHLSVPLLAPHKTEKEIKLGEHVVPKNTQILVNVWAMSKDPTYWENPLSFMPERFMNTKVDYKGQHFEFLPFGSGRRMCPGMPLAQRVVSLMVASFVYHFDWKLPHAREDMDMNTVFGITLLRATPLAAYPVKIE